MASSSIPTPFLNSQKEKVKDVLNQSEYLDLDIADTSIDPARGINLIFSRFQYKLHTFQYVTNKDGKTHSPVRTYSDRKKALFDASKYNKEGFDVFFMVNEGDGIIHEGKKVPRSQLSVVNLSKCFLDTDSCPIEKVNEYLASIRLKPHLVIESSPNRFHLYFFIDPAEKTPQNIIHWKAIQHMIHRLGDPSIKNPSKTLGTDSTMSDFSKVLRVPGFTHISKLTPVKIISDQDFPPYSLDDLFSLVNGQSYIDYTINTFGAFEPSNLPDLTDTSILSKGERFHALQSLSLHLANSNMSYTDKQGMYALFVRSRLDNSDQVYADSTGKLTEKALALFTSAIDKVKKEEVQAIHVVQLGPPTDTPSPWTLPDSFYTQAPNGFGDVVSQVLKYSLYPCASLAFGTFITGLSILKARTHLTPHGSSPALYTLNVAPTGYGKSDPMSLLQNMFVSLGMGRLIENEIRSDRGLYAHLAANNGLGLFILDEVSPLLRSIQSKDSSGHLVNIGKAFLSLYSAGAMKGISFGKLASSNTKKGEKAIVLDNPMIALCGYTVPSEFYGMFNEDSVMQGLFQRFIPIVAEIVHTPKNPEANKLAIIQSELFKLPIEAVELNDDGEPVEPLQAVARVKMPFTPEALKRFNELSEYYRAKLIDTAKDSELAHTSGLYSRLAEQIERIATVLSPEEIELDTLEYSINFMESRHKAIMAVAEVSVLRGQGSKTLELENVITSTVARLCCELETNIVSKRDVYQRCRRSFDSTKQFDFIVNEAVESEKIEIVNGFKTGKKNSQPQLGLKLGVV